MVTPKQLALAREAWREILAEKTKEQECVKNIRQGLVRAKECESFIAKNHGVSSSVEWPMITES